MPVVAMHSTPRSLLLRLRDPAEGRAWDQFVELYSPLLFAWARRVGLRDDDAGDLVQDVFVVLLRSLPTFEYDAAKGFRNWLKTVVMNKWRERMRRRVPAVADLDGVAAPPDGEPFWEDEYRGHVTRRLLEVMRRDFEEATWRACWECVVEGRSAADVGGDLGLSVGAVRAAKFRVLCRLREEAKGLLD